jgi:hypothetical protein
VLAGHERGRLVAALAVLQAELGPREGPSPAEPQLPRAHFDALLGAEDEELVRELGRSLAELAEATASAHPPAVPLPSITNLGAVGGSEWVMRQALLTGERGRLAELVPDFVFLVTLPYLEQAGAKAAAARSRELIEDGRDGD